MKINKNKIFQILTGFLWLLTAGACLTLLVSAASKKDTRYCTGAEVDISGVSNTYFMDKHDVYAIIKKYGGDTSLKQPIASIDLRKIERALEKDVWIKNAELFFDNNNMLRISVEEREPIARVFTVMGNSFYIDSSCMMLPLSEKFSARLPLFTGFTSDAKILSKADSSLLCDIRNISTKINADDFLMAMIDQVDITVKRTFEMMPKIGKQRIIFGDGSDAANKFVRLKLFYKNVISSAGWNRYNTIDLQYKDQVVAAVRGKEDVITDSLKTLEIMKMIAEDAARRAADSTLAFVQDSDKNTADSSMILQSIERDDRGGAAQVSATQTFSSIPVINTPITVQLAPSLKPAVLPVAKPAEPVKKPVAAVVPKPKIVTKVNTQPVVKKLVPKKEAPVKKEVKHNF